MTKDKKRDKRASTLYLGLLLNIVVGLLLAGAVFSLVFFPGNYYIRYIYLSDVQRDMRHQSFLADLEEYVTEERVALSDVDRIADWVRQNPCVYLLVYKTENTLPVSVYGQKSITPGPRDKLSEYSGARIDESIEREQLISDAQSGGYYEVELADGSVIVALSEYTEELYRDGLTMMGIGLGFLFFILSLINYVRRIIKRIKRFERDVTIVSNINMNYEIMSDGADEIGKLSRNVEIMRRSMLENIKNEQEARRANTELITSISHDIRTPLTVLMGYLEMMKNYDGCDETLQSYISAGENTALRLKQLSDDMFKYALAFGDATKDVKLEEYDARTLVDQLLSEHVMLMVEQGYTFSYDDNGNALPEGSTIRTDAPNLMRIIENVFSNLRKYADIRHPITVSRSLADNILTYEVVNKIRHDTDEVESNGIGLKTCVRLASIVAEGFEYESDGEYFTCRLSIMVGTAKE